MNGHTHDVVVFDLCGPRARLSALGQDFADSLSKSLRNDFPGLSVRDRDAVRTAIEQNHLAPAVICNKQAAQWLASQLHVDSFLVGFLTDVNNQLSVGVEAVRVGNGNVISEFTATAPLSNEMKARLTQLWGRSMKSTHIIWSSRRGQRRSVSIVPARGTQAMLLTPKSKGPSSFRLLSGSMVAPAI